MDHDTYYSVFGDDLIPLEPLNALPDGFASLVSRKIELFLDRPVLTIGTWNEPNRPLVLALDASGSLISVITVSDHDIASLPEVVESIVAWLGPLRLRDLRDLTNDPAAFYEGLWDLSPDASITLNSSHHITLITSSGGLDAKRLSEPFDGWSVDVVTLDVFRTVEGGPPIIKRRAPQQDDPIGTPPLLVGSSDANPIRIRPGATFPINRLPLLFDPLGEDLLSISDELFAVTRDLVLVDALRGRLSESPFEARNRFRWETSGAQLQLLATHSVDTSQRPRTIHLFVETDQQSGYCVYVGVIAGINSPRDQRSNARWFSIAPPLDPELYRLLQNGQLPEHSDNPTVDFGALDS